MNKSHKKVNMTKYLVLPPSTLRVERQMFKYTDIISLVCRPFPGEEKQPGDYF